MPAAETYRQQALSVQNEQEFNALALELFHWQLENNPVYGQFIELMKVEVNAVEKITDIPFLPIEFFKTHKVATGNFEPEAVFESSGTTGNAKSRHFVASEDHYMNTFCKGFELAYGSPSQYTILALLPSYLERSGSSLVVMADELIRRSGQPESGFYLNEFEKLNATLKELERSGQPTILLGVSFALLDLAEQHPQPLNHAIIMETGGMKGRREELVRSELHDRLKAAFALEQVHSEYGMTELMSQAYSKGGGLFNCPPWMRVLVRDVDDPVHTRAIGRGALNIIDLANVDSCCFIATQDVGSVNKDGSFEVLGRMDHSDVRGCNLLVV